ncbi:MAG: hypothetical protein NC832_01255 [Candidatus Omnitrophica bacterium]|nr:hypothetical protein [Candidatus Omnitrophota bacterium]
MYSKRRWRMIDYGGGFFLGLHFGITLIVVAIEFYFCVFTRYIDKEIEGLEFLILSLITLLCILFSLPLSKFSIGLWGIFPLPIGYFTFRIMERCGIELEFRNRIERKLKTLKENARRNPHIPEIFTEIGDIYFNLKRYEEALPYYYRAYSLKESAEISHKIKIAERENKIQKGEIWICSECGTTNSGSSDKCIKCGNSNRAILSVKQDLIRNKDEIKKWVIKGFSIPFAGIFIVIFLKTFLHQTAFFFTAIFISLLVMYLLWRTFWTSL